MSWNGRKLAYKSLPLVPSHQIGASLAQVGVDYLMSVLSHNQTCLNSRVLTRILGMDVEMDVLNLTWVIRQAVVVTTLISNKLDLHLEM